MTYTNEERQRALDWLKAKIKPRLPFAKGVYRMTEEQLDSITIDLDDELNKARIHYLLQMVWRNWVTGEDWVIEWDYRLLNPLDEPLIAMDEDCDCNDLNEGDPCYFDLYCKLYNNSEAIDNATVFIESMDHEEVQTTIETLNARVLYFKWKYEPETLTDREKMAVLYNRFKTRDEAEVRTWLANDSYVVDFPGTEREEPEDEGYPYYEEVCALANSNDLSYEKIKDTFDDIAVKLGIEEGDASEAMSRLKAMWVLNYIGWYDLSGLKQCGQGDKYDFELGTFKYEVKTRRGRFNKDYFCNGKGPGCELHKVDTADRLLTVASDGWAGCWDIKNHYEVGYPSHQFKNDYDKKYEVRTPMAYYRITDAIWETQVPRADWELWEKIDKVWEEQKPKKDVD